jgi:hypothetical protein
VVRKASDKGHVPTVLVSEALERHRFRQRIGDEFQARWLKIGAVRLLQLGRRQCPNPNSKNFEADVEEMAGTFRCDSLRLAGALRSGYRTIGPRDLDRRPVEEHSPRSSFVPLSGPPKRWRAKFYRFD